MNLSYSAVKALLDPFFHTYKCKDGRSFYLVAVAHAVHQTRCLQALGVWDELLSLGLPQGDVWRNSDEWEAECVLGTFPLTDPKWIQRIKDLCSRAFLTRDAEEWEALFRDLKIPGSVVRTTREWIHSEHAVSSGLVIEHTTADGRRVKQAGPLAWLSRPPLPASEAQRSEARARAARSATVSGPWLAGTNVLDLCNVIAGPVIGGMLARFGADVIKLDPADPKYDPRVSVYFGLPASRGKRSVLVDVKATEGKAVLEALIRWADVVIVNQATSQLAALGVDSRSIKALNQSAILMHLDAFGGPGRGPRSDAIGYDDLLQVVPPTTTPSCPPAPSSIPSSIPS